MTLHQVDHESGHFGVRLTSGSRMPICLGHRPVEKFGPGWTPQFVYDGLAPIYLLELRHENGSLSTWYLDADMNRLGGEIEELSDATRRLLGEKAGALQPSLWQALLVPPEPGWPEVTGHLGVLNPSTAKAIQALANAPTPERDIAWQGLADLPADAPILIDDGTGREVALAPAHLRALLQVDLQKNFLAALNARTLRFPSPISGRPLSRVHSLYIDNMLVLYRCFDEEHQLAFYVVCAGHHMQLAGVLFAATDQGFFATPRQHHLLRTLCPDLKRRVGLYLRRSGRLLPRYFATPLIDFATPIWGGGFHIGHHLWNELSGLESAVTTLPARALPKVMMLGERGEGEAYGEIEALFPELAPLVVRTPTSDEELVALCCAQNIQLLRITGEYVSRGLRGRIMQGIHAEALTPGSALSEDQNNIAALRAEHIPIVVLGLRVENRTVADLESLLLRTVEYLQRRLGHVAVVLDGHNSRGIAGDDSAYPSFTEQRAAQPPVVVERQLGQALAARFAGNGVRIVDNIGRSMRAGLLWIDAADFFITPWGAGLAKYRWVCNKPGIILSSRWVLTEKGDLHIYDSATYMESPAPVAFIDPTDVFDIAEEPVLVQVFEPHHPMYYNFKVNMGALYRLIDTFLPDDTAEAAA